MKKNYFPSALLILFMVVVATSCTTMKTTQIKQTYSEKIAYVDLECSKTELEEVDLFLVNDSLDFNYEEVGFVKAYGEFYVPDSLILYRLKYSSYSLCANGVVQVKQSKTTKEGVSVKVFSGIAVLIEKDSTYYSKYPFEEEFDFYDFAVNDYTSETEVMTGFGKVMAVVGIAAAVILIIFGEEDEDEFEVIEFQTASEDEED
ncbi:MAG: hypothetical protein ABF242_08580 [Flavobacteriales bacterium]